MHALSKGVTTCTPLKVFLLLNVNTVFLFDGLTSRGDIFFLCLPDPSSQLVKGPYLLLTLLKYGRNPQLIHSVLRSQFQRMQIISCFVFVYTIPSHVTFCFLRLTQRSVGYPTLYNRIQYISIISTIFKG